MRLSGLSGLISVRQTILNLQFESVNRVDGELGHHPSNTTGHKLRPRMDFGRVIVPLNLCKDALGGLQKSVMLHEMNQR
jgi:hypothetical protein